MGWWVHMSAEHTLLHQAAWGRTLAALPDGPGLHWPQALAGRWAARGSPADWSLDHLTWEQPFLFQCPAC